MEFHILGPLEVFEDGQAIDLGGQKQRALLAVLLLHANEVVSSDRLMDALWPERPPDTAAKALQVYVSQLRKLLGRERLETRPPGYLLRVGKGELDAELCLRLAEEGRPREALALWRGPPLSDFAFEPFANPEIARLDELRVTCLEERVEEDLAAGRHAAVVGELESLVASHPLRERLRAQLMLALYRSDRQAEALDCYQVGRNRLSDELGLEPGESLKALQRQILAHDPALDLPERTGSVHPSPEPGEGPAPPASEVREARKTVTVLVAALTLADSGDEPMDPETQRHVTDRLFGEVEAAVGRHGGSVETIAGDALTAVFGVPAVHEDDALRAVRAAADFMGRPDVRLGLSTGEVITGGAESTEPRSTGRPITIAARLAQVAAPGELLLDEASSKAVKGAVDVDESEHGLRLVAVRPDEPGGRRRFDAPMVGRDRERRRLEDAFDQAVGDRSCQLFTILGAAGVGKSRLVREFLDGLPPEVTVVRGRCLAYGQGITYFPLMEAVRDAAGLEDTETPEESLARIAAMLADEEDAALLARRVGELVGLSEVGVGVQESFAAVRALFESIARHSLLAIVFDDIHWGEATFLDLVEDVADGMRDTAALVVAVARPELLDVRPGWSGGKLNATSVLLEPLSEEESAKLIDGLAGVERLSEETRRRIVSAAEGNPLFVEEMLALVLEEGEPTAAVEVPPTIQALLAARLDHLDGAERAVIEYAAVQGKEFFESAVTMLAPERLQPVVGATLSSLVRKELIRPSRAGMGGKAYRFRHQLIRDAAYDSIPKQSRARLHEDFAVWFEGAAGPRAGEYDEVVGYHREQAYRYRVVLGQVDEDARGLARKAAEQLGAAGRRALMRSDVPAGSNLISRAVALLGADDPLRVELIPTVRKIQGMTGDLSWADRALTEAVETAATSGDRNLAAHALLQRAFLRLFRDADTTPAELLDVAERAIAVFAEQNDDLGLARAWRLVAQAHYLAHRAAASAEASERALGYMKGPANDLEEYELIEWLICAYEFGPTPVTEALARLERLLEDHGSNPVADGLLRSAVAVFEAARGRAEEAEAILARARSIIDEQGELIPLFFWNAASTRVLNGELELAAADLRVGWNALWGMGKVGHFTGLSVFLAQVCYALGLEEEAGQFAGHAREVTRANDVYDQASWRATQARLLAKAGKLSEADALARESVTFALEGDFVAAQAESLDALAEVLQAAGRRSEAVACLEQVVRLWEAKEYGVAAAAAQRRLEDLRAS